MEPFLAVSALETLNILASVIGDIANTESPRTVIILCTKPLNDLDIHQLHLPKIIHSKILVHSTIPKVTDEDMIVLVTSTDREAKSIIRDIDIETPAKFLVLWSEGGDFQGVFQTCWSRNLIRVVAAVVGASVPLYTFVPFTETSCVDTRPVLVGRWPGSIKNVFPPGNIHDVHGCLINATAIHYPPYLLLRERMPSLKEEMSGSWAPILKMMVLKLNAKIHLFPRPNRYWPDRHNITDAFFFGKFASTPLRARTMDMPMIARADCYSFCVPRSEQNLGYWRKLLKPLDSKTWWAISISLLANLFTTYALFSGTEPIGRLALNIIAKLPGNTGNKVKEGGVMCMLVTITWALSCLIFMTLYQAKEHSFRSTLARLDWIRSVDDMVMFDLQVRGDAILVEAIEDIFPALNLGAFESEYGIFDEPLEALSGYIADIEECSILNERRGFRKDGRHPMALLEGCAFIVHERLFLLPRHSPFTKRVEDVHMRLTEAGILHHLMDKDPLPEAVSIPLRKLSMTDMVPVFTLLVSGLAAGLVMLVTELVSVKYGRFVPKFIKTGLHDKKISSQAYTKM